MSKKSPLNQTANQLQLDYNKQKADYDKLFFGDSNAFGDLQKLNQSITDTKNLELESYKKREDERWNAKNPLAPEESSLGPMISNTEEKGYVDRTGDTNMISMGSGFNNFTESSQVAANGLFGGDQIENSFNRPLPISEQQLNNDDIGMNSLYNNNKTV